MTKSSKSIPSTVYYNATTASNDKDRDTLLNQYSHSISNQVSSNQIVLFHIPIPSASNIEISEAEVYEALTLLDPSKLGYRFRWYWSKNTQELCTVSLSDS